MFLVELDMAGGENMAGKEDPSEFASLMKDMSDIQTMSREARAKDLEQKNRSLKLDKNKEQLRKAALGETQDNLEQLRARKPENYGPNDIMGFKQPGVQEGVYRKLRTGKYPIEAKLDLHGFTLEQAFDAIRASISLNMKKNKRCLLISHGKGLKQDEPARLKNHVAAWLKGIPEVMAYHSAMPQHGGAGNVYVLLKKSETQKQNNRERFNHSK